MLGSRTCKLGCLGGSQTRHEPTVRCPYPPTSPFSIPNSNGVLKCINRIVWCQDAEKSLLQLNLKCRIQFRALDCRKDIAKLEYVQRKTIKMINVLKANTYGNGWKYWLCLWRREVCKEPREIYSSIWGGCYVEDRVDLFSIDSDDTRQCVFSIKTQISNKQWEEFPNGTSCSTIEQIVLESNILLRGLIC